jgi:hypothetical protein
MTDTMDHVAGGEEEKRMYEVVEWSSREVEQSEVK